ncbi:MAG: hypothetical protein ACR2G4_06230 [Pyrinomonadaceae bacterium]
MKKKSVLLSLLAAATVIGIMTKTVITQSQREKRPAYTIMWQATDYNTSGESVPVYTETRYVSSNGNWRNVKQYTDGQTIETFGEVGRGVFSKKGRKLDFLSGYAKAKPILKAEGFLNSPNYLRTETVMGQTAIVVKTKNDPDGRVEIFVSPILNGDTIKMIFHGEITTVVEPISLTFGEPDPAFLHFSKDFPVDYENNKKLHAPHSQ